MTRKSIIVLLALSLLATACGARVGSKQARDEARADALLAGGVRGSGGAASDLGGVGAEGGVAGDISGAAGSTGVGGSTGGSGGSTGAVGGGGSGASGGSAAKSGTAGSTGGGFVASSEVGVSQTTINLGWVGTLQGPVPGLFRGALVATQAFANYQNSKGGLFGRQLKVVPGDDALDSGKNRAAHLQLKDKVFSFVGSFSINDDGGAAVVNDCQCPDVSGNLSQQMQSSAYHYGPQPAPLGWREGPPVWYAQKFGNDVIKHWAHFVSQNATSSAIAAQARKAYEKAGFVVVYTRDIPTNDNQQRADVVQMQNAKVRSLSWEGDLGAMTKLANEMQKQNFVVDLANWGGAMYDKNLFALTTIDALKNDYGDSTFGLFLGEDAAAVPEIQLFLDWMKRTDPNQSIDLFALYGWTSARLFSDAMTAMAKSGSPLSRKALLAALANIGTWDANGMVGVIDVAKKKPSDCFFIKQPQPDKKWKRVFPTDGRLYACDVAPFLPAAQLG